VPTADNRLRQAMPLAEMVTWELAEYRSDLEEALALDTLPPLYAPRDVLEKRLADVTAEQAERAAIRQGKPAPADA
jgi:hypothetical protein